MNNFEHIAGYHKEKAELSGLRNILLNLSKLRESGIRMPRGVLLYGEPGVGKTVMARAVGGDGISFVEIRAADCTKDTSEDFVVSAFEEARSKEPCVLLIDELDKIADSHDMYYKSGNDRIMKVLLQELDGRKDNSGIIVIATCNSYKGLNSAMLRSGRFDRIIEIGKPSLQDRIEIIDYYLSKITLEKRVDVEYFAKITAGYSGALLECIINEAGLIGMQGGHGYIDMDSLRVSMNRIAFKAIEGKTENNSELWKVAVHEAGHALVTMLVTPDKLASASVIPHGRTRGHIRLTYDSDVIESIEDVENSVRGLVAGAAAEEVILGKRYTGSANDMETARILLLRITAGVGAYGLEYAGYLCSDRLNFEVPQEVKNKVGAICGEKIKEFYADAKRIITANKVLLESIARSLMEKSSLSEEEMFEIKNSIDLKA